MLIRFNSIFDEERAGWPSIFDGSLNTNCREDVYCSNLLRFIAHESPENVSNVIFQCFLMRHNAILISLGWKNSCALGSVLRLWGIQ